MLLSASLWKPCLHYLAHVLLKPQFSMFLVHLIFVSGMSECEGWCQFDWVFLSGSVKQQSWSVIITFPSLTFMYIVCTIVVWSRSFRPVCTYNPVLVVVICLLCWQKIYAFVIAEPYSLHDVTFP